MYFDNARVNVTPVLFLCARNAGILPAVFTTLIPAIRSYHCNFPTPHSSRRTCHELAEERESLQIPNYSYLEYSRNKYILACMDIKKTIYSEQYKTIIHNLKEARLKQGLTQKDVAKHFGVGQSFISKIESGQYRLDILQLQEFAKLYKTTFTSFLKEE